MSCPPLLLAFTAGVYIIFSRPPGVEAAVRLRRRMDVYKALFQASGRRFYILEYYNCEFDLYRVLNGGASRRIIGLVLAVLLAFYAILSAIPLVSPGLWPFL